MKKREVMTWVAVVVSFAIPKIWTKMAGICFTFLCPFSMTVVVQPYRDTRKERTFGRDRDFRGLYRLLYLYGILKDSDIPSYLTNQHQ